MTKEVELSARIFIFVLYHGPKAKISAAKASVLLQGFNERSGIRSSLVGSEFIKLGFELLHHVPRIADEVVS